MQRWFKESRRVGYTDARRDTGTKTVQVLSTLSLYPNPIYKIYKQPLATAHTPPVPGSSPTPFVVWGLGCLIAEGKLHP